MSFATDNKSRRLQVILQGKYNVSFIEGDGIGPEIAQSVKDIFAAAKVSHSSARLGQMESDNHRYQLIGNPSMSLPHSKTGRLLFPTPPSRTSARTSSL